MRYLEAAILVLSAADGPLSAGVITERAVSRNLVRPKGRTPITTMSAELYVEARRPDARVVKVATAGHNRAIRGSVRWALAKPSDAPGG